MPSTRPMPSLLRHATFAAVLFALTACSRNHILFGERDSGSPSPDAMTGVDAGEVETECIVGVDCGFERRRFVKPPGARSQAASGAALALSGDGSTLAVGAPDDPSAWDGLGCDGSSACADPRGTYRGSVHVLVRDGSGWRAQAFLKPPVSRDREHFGNSVALSGDGDVIAVGGKDHESHGAVHVFVREGDTWSYQAALEAPAPDRDDDFGAGTAGVGVALSSDGTLLAVAAPSEDGSARGLACDGSPSCADDGAEESGAVYVFARTGAEWTLEAYLKASNASAGDLFGSAVAISADGTVLGVSAMGESTEARGGECDGSAACENDLLPSSGAIYVFERTEGQWAQAGFVKPGYPRENEMLGQYLAMSGSGDRIATASPWVGPGAGSHLVHVFARTGAGWAESATLGPPGHRLSFLGSSLALSFDGSLLAAGDGSESGTVRIYRAMPAGWVHSQSLSVERTETSGSGFPTALGISWDGTTLAAGERGEDSAEHCDGSEACRLGGPNSGAVHLFELTPTR